MSKVRTRFAPSPTGRMHVGNLRTALYAYLIAKHEGGEFILRIEDTDQERLVEGATDIIYRTLQKTGLIHDEGPDKDGGVGPYIQSERQKQGIYLEYAKQLVEKGEAYYCFCDKERLDRLAGTGHHQGVVAIGAAYEYAEVSDILENAERKGEPPFIIILDGIEDPHNLGAIIRTANQAGAHGIIIPKRRAVGLTPTVAKTSAGAINYTPVAKVTNISNTIKELKEKGMWFVCADMGGTTMYDLNLTGPIGLVIGNEGDGVSKLVKENCDMTASIPMVGDIDSLNASVATGVLAYEIVRQRLKSGK